MGARKYLRKEKGTCGYSENVDKKIGYDTLKLCLDWSKTEYFDLSKIWKTMHNLSCIQN